MPKDIAAEIKALHKMTTGELAERYEELHGQPVRTRHRAYLIRKIAWRIQANAEGDLTERARKRAAELADDADIRVMAPKTLICPPESGRKATVGRRLSDGQHDDPRIPSPGSAIVREYKRRTIRVVVLGDGELVLGQVGDEPVAAVGNDEGDGDLFHEDSDGRAFALLRL